jgi:selenide,water dikinase
MLPADMPEWRRHLLTDPQTSGGLLIACAADKAAALVERIVAGGYPSASVIGHVEPGTPVIMIET